MINISCISDNNYCQHLGAMLCSLLESCKNPSFIEIYLITNGISSKNERRLKSLINIYNSKIHFLKTSLKKYKSFPISHHINQTAYIKLSIPDLLSNSCKRTIYLDCDLIVKDDIFDLWVEYSKNETIINAVINPGFKRHLSLGIPSDKQYFNAGVMVIDMERWRINDITQKAITYGIANKNKLELWDQDILNAVLYNDWSPVHPKWNQQQRFYEIPESIEEFNENEFKETLNNPSIIHFTGSLKPSHRLSESPYKNLYREYLKKTPFRNYRETDRNIKNMLYKSRECSNNFLTNLNARMKTAIKALSRNL